LAFELQEVQARWTSGCRPRTTSPAVVRETQVQERQGIEGFDYFLGSEYPEEEEWPGIEDVPETVNTEVAVVTVQEGRGLPGQVGPPAG
jgi:hypothetical protein